MDSVQPAPPLIDCNFPKFSEAWKRYLRDHGLVLTKHRGGLFPCLLRWNETFLALLAFGREQLYSLLYQDAMSLF